MIEKITLLFKKLLFSIAFLFLSVISYSQAADFKVQHLEDDVANTGGTNTSFTAVSSLNSAFALANNNRKTHTGYNGWTTGNLNGDDMAGARVLTDLTTLSYYRESGSISQNMRFNSSIWEYVGPVGGANEMIVRGRYAVVLNGATNSVTQAISGISNANDCIPFITGILNDDTSSGADSGTALAYLENATTLRVQKGTNSNNVTVYITLVEFTGSNWSVLHGDSGNTGGHTGTITLRNTSDGTGTATNVSDWSDAVIFSHFRADTAGTGTNEAIEDLWPILDPGSNNQTVDWSFQSTAHGSNGTNRHFTHVLVNANLNVLRYQNTSNTANGTTLPITSLSSKNEAFIVGSSVSSGGGTAYGRGWRNYYLNSITEAEHWAHRSGNTMAHEIQIVDLSGLNSPSCTATGNILLERYDGISGTTIADLTAAPNYPNSPTTTSLPTSFEAPTNIANDYGVRMRGFICAPETGTYYFWVAGDDNVELNLSTDDTEANKIQIAYHNDWTGSREWNKFSTQKSVGITLTAGQSYYIEALMKEGGGGDNLAVGWRKPSDGNGTSPVEVIPGSYLSPANVTIAYCTSYGNTDYDTGVTYVEFNLMTNADGSPKDNGYEDFTAMSTDVTQGASYDLTVNVDTDGGYTVHVFAWIDWNQDGDFSDSGEDFDLGQTTVDGAMPSSPYSITIPAAATLGSTRMRVSARYNNNPDSCDTNFDGEVEDYSINVISSTPQPEINIVGLGTTINNGDNLPSATDNTLYGSTGTGSPISHTFTIQNIGTLPLTIGAISFSGANPGDFTVSSPPSGTIAASGSSSFTVDFNPSANGTRTAIISIPNNDTTGGEDPYTFTLQGTGVVPLTEAPGGVTADLGLWLKANEGLGYTSGDNVSLWADQGRGSDATVNTVGQEPTYRDEASYNINFNPVVKFTNAYNSVVKDTDFSFDNTNTEFLEGSSGFYSQDIFVVFISDLTPINNSFGFMDMFCSDADISTDEEDATGIGLGDYSGRMDGEIIMYAHSTYSTSTPNDGYGVAEIGTGSSYNNVGIINAHNNLTLPQQELRYNASDIGNTQNNVIDDMINVNDTKFWIGRSEGWEASLNGRIAEIITYSARKDDTNLTQERNRIQSYLAVKYGITLGVNGTSQDYVDSDGAVIWDQSVNVGFNYDIAGIGRDDVSELIQKQSKSVNRMDGNDITIGLTDIYSTNNENITTNSNTFNNKEFLMWGNNDGSLAAQPNINVDMSAGISGLSTPVWFTAIGRTWKVVEKGTIGMSKVALPEAMLSATISPPGDYLMFISDNSSFGPTSEYRILSSDGSGNLEATYDFPTNGTKYITFGYAPERTFTRSIYFGGTQDYLDAGDVLDLNPSEFTISAWIKRGSSSANKSILSKRNAGYSDGGYDFKITSTGKVEMSWKNGGTRTITSVTTIPTGIWHQVAVIYDGTIANLYIDGVLDSSLSLGAPIAPASNNESFIIAAADAANGSTTAFFEGNIDEVRVWDKALTENELHFIMNQEIEDNTDVAGSYFTLNSISPTKNDISAGTLDWSNLKGYYPMSTYTFTNCKDASGNGNTAALKNLNTVDYQTAPLPYVSAANTSWDTATTWNADSFQTIPGSVSLVDPTKTVDWNIVQISSNVTMNNTALPAANNGNRKVLGLIVDNSRELTAQGTTSMTDGTDTGNGLTVTHYLGLDGKIDLEGGSQLIQTLDSDLVTTATGELERDQQGTASSYNYNYWSSSVGPKNAGSTNLNYTLGNYAGNTGVLYDGRTSTPAEITFTTNYGAADGTSIPIPMVISTYWLRIFNGTNDTYSQWSNPLNPNTSLLEPGEGFTMKGVNGSAAFTDFHNLTFVGRPNNGDILLSITAGNDRLIGNPYPSAIDANEFILDNISDSGGRAVSNIFNGALYFWHHFSKTSHNLGDYIGGYATYTLMGGVQAISSDTRINATGDSGGRIPERYIPVNQGFFVNTTIDAALANSLQNPSIISGGTIQFKNSQRVFELERSTGSNSGSLFFKGSASKNAKTGTTTRNTDPRKKIRLKFSSPQGYYRQLLVGVDENTTNNFDIGYDAPIADVGNEDMFWIFNESKFVIQGVNNFNKDQELPFGIIVEEAGLVSIEIDALENLSEDFELYVKDNFVGKTYKINESVFEVNLEAGAYLDRFSIVFQPNLLTLEEIKLAEGVHTFMNNATSELQIKRIVDTKLESIYLFNALGQLVNTWQNNLEERFISLPINNSTGVYFVQINTSGGVINKKIIIE